MQPLIPFLLYKQDKLDQKPNNPVCVSISLLFVCLSHPLTIWWELVFLKHSDTEDILVEVFDKELAVEVPLWVQGVTDWSGGVALRPHRQLTVGITLTWREIIYY